jgi:hypothetical protein
LLCLKRFKAQILRISREFPNIGKVSVIDSSARVDSSRPGGIATFAGFTRAQLLNLTPGEEATINVDGGPGITIDGVGAITPCNISNANVFVISGQPAGDFFQVTEFTATFTGTAAAVPEPSAFVAFVFVAPATPMFGRFRRRAKSLDSRWLAV